MQIAILGVGNIGGNCATQLVRADHHVSLSYSRDPRRLDEIAQALGPSASVVTPADAVDSADVVIFAVPWRQIDDALSVCGPLAGKIVIDTTNQFGPSGWIDLSPMTAAQHNAARMPDARYTKTFNTLTSGFQAASAGRTGDDRVAQWICGDDLDAKRVVAQLLMDCGYYPVDLGSTETCAVMDAPRRAGAVYGEEYRVVDADAVRAAHEAGNPIPSAPPYP